MNRAWDWRLFQSHQMDWQRILKLQAEYKSKHKTPLSRLEKTWSIAVENRRTPPPLPPLPHPLCLQSDFCLNESWHDAFPFSPICSALSRAPVFIRALINCCCMLVLSYANICLVQWNHEASAPSRAFHRFSTTASFLLFLFCATVLQTSVKMPAYEESHESADVNDALFSSFNSENISIVAAFFF